MKYVFKKKIIGIGFVMTEVYTIHFMVLCPKRYVEALQEYRWRDHSNQVQQISLQSALLHP